MYQSRREAFCQHQCLDLATYRNLMVQENTSQGKALYYLHIFTCEYVKNNEKAS